MNRASQHANNKDIWETPPKVFSEIDDAFGNRFVLDVAASDENHLCPRYFTEETNALVQEWTVGIDELWWCNPPFSLKEEFLAKAVEQWAKGNQGVMLLPSSQEAEWFRKYITHPHRPRVTWPGRIQFLIHGQRQKRTDKKGKIVVSGNVGGSVIIAFIQNELILPSELAGEPWVR
jgi:phage N-6-adenine-methyltransferase